MNLEQSHRDIACMKQTGQEMSLKYKGTIFTSLAVSFTGSRRPAVIIFSFYQNVFLSNTLNIFILLIDIYLSIVVHDYIAIN